MAAGGAGGVEVGRVSIRVVPNTDRFRSTLKRKLEEIERTMRAEIPVDADLSRFRRKVETAIRSLPTATIDVDANTAGVRQKIQAQTKGIKAEVDVDVKRGVFDRIAKAMSKIEPPSFGSGINLTGYAVILALIATAAPLIMGLLGSITTALLAVPGLISAALVPISAMALGLDGLKRAAERLKVPFENLKKTMSAAVEKQFAPLFDQLRPLFDVAERALPAVTQGLADMAKSVVDVVTSGDGMAQIERIIGNIAQGLKDAAPGLGDFTAGLLDLVENFTKRLPDVSEWFNETGESFKKWAEEFTKEGPDGKSKFDKTLDSLGETLKLLGGGLVELGGKALDFMSDPEKVKAFRTELDGLVNSVLALADALSTISRLLAKIPGFSDGEANSIMDFAPLPIQLLKEVDWAGIWQGYRDAVLTVFAEIVTAAATTVSQIVAKFTALPQQLAGVFAGVVAQAASIVGQIVSHFAQLPGQVSGAWNALVSVAQGIFSAVVSVAASLIPQVVQTFVTVGGQILAEVSSWPGKIVGALGDLAGQLAAAGRAAGEALINALAGAISAGGRIVSGAVGKLMGSVLSMIPRSPAKEGPLSGSGWQAITNFGQTLGDALASGIPGAQDQVVDRLRELLQAVKDVMGDIQNLVININLGSPMTSLSDTMDSVATSAQSFRDNMASAVGPAKKLDSATKAQLDELQIQKDMLELERQKLQAQRNQLPSTDKAGRAALQQQIDQLNIQKQQLQLQYQQLKFQAQYTDSVSETNQQYGEILNKAIKLPLDFAKATGNQLLEDFGMGGGALTAALEQGIQFGEQFIFNVASMDEAIAGQQSIVNKKALQYNQR